MKQQGHVINKQIKESAWAAGGAFHVTRQCVSVSFSKAKGGG
jgi:hypothetical protein